MAGNFVTRGIIKGACLNVFGEGGDHVRQTIPREKKMMKKNENKY